MGDVHGAAGPSLEARAPIQEQGSQGAPGAAPASDIEHLPRDREGWEPLSPAQGEGCLQHQAVAAKTLTWGHPQGHDSLFLQDLVKDYSWTMPDNKFHS